MEMLMELVGKLLRKQRSYLFGKDVKKISRI